MRRRRAVGTVLALLVALSLAACGGAAQYGSARSGAGFGGNSVDLVNAPAQSAPFPNAQSGDAPMPVAPEHFDAPAAAPAPPPSSLQSPASGVTAGGGTWAVVVGINHYPGGNHDLLSAVADANDMATALSMLGVPADHVLRLTDAQATASVIDQGVEWMAAHASPDAIATFFFAGHVRKLAPTTEALVGSDGNLVTDTDLAQHLSHVAARRAWIVIAGCYGGGFEEALKPGRILTGAADANSLAYENESFGRSYLVEFMIRQAIIEGRAPATVQSAFNYASSAISQQYPGRQPVEYEDQVGPLDIRPPGVPADAYTAAPADASPPSPPPTSPPPTSPPPSTPDTSPPPSTPPPTSTTTDGCAQLTAGVVHCGP